MKTLRKYEKEVKTFKIGDQILVPLAEHGEFTATVHQITEDGVLFIFDEYIARRPMNMEETNNGGFEKSDLKRWLDTKLYTTFPDWLRDRITDLSIPTVGQLFGHRNEWDAAYFEPDTDEQLPLMKECKNRVAHFKDELVWGWLRNATKQECSSDSFANADHTGYAAYSDAFISHGVRPVFLLTKVKIEMV